uniref:Uncharacterized protein n=1 Tax=Cannabis sativa TaxID=3483 RepID=A0A803PZP9_CANSA
MGARTGRHTPTPSETFECRGVQVAVTTDLQGLRTRPKVHHDHSPKQVGTPKPVIGDHASAIQDHTLAARDHPPAVGDHSFITSEHRPTIGDHLTPDKSTRRKATPGTCNPQFESDMLIHFDHVVPLATSAYRYSERFGEVRPRFDQDLVCLGLPSANRLIGRVLELWRDWQSFDSVLERVTGFGVIRSMRRTLWRRLIGSLSRTWSLNIRWRTHWLGHLRLSPFRLLLKVCFPSRSLNTFCVLSFCMTTGHGRSVSCIESFPLSASSHMASWLTRLGYPFATPAQHADS